MQRVEETDRRLDSGCLQRSPPNPLSGQPVLGALVPREIPLTNPIEREQCEIARFASSYRGRSTVRASPPRPSVDCIRLRLVQLCLSTLVQLD
jgi:hypothetical protein